MDVALILDIIEAILKALGPSNPIIAEIEKVMELVRKDLGV